MLEVAAGIACQCKSTKNTDPINLQATFLVAVPRTLPFPSGLHANEATLDASHGAPNVQTFCHDNLWSAT
jgi:hypothetical protein